VYNRNDFYKAADSIWFNYLWLKAGGKIKVVEGMEYIQYMMDPLLWRMLNTI